MSTNNNNNNNEPNNTNNNNNSQEPTPNNNNNSNQSTGLTAEQVKAMVAEAVETARKAEKDKLYDKIKTLEADLKAAQGSNTTLTKDLAEAKEALEKLNNQSSNTNGGNTQPQNNNTNTQTPQKDPSPAPAQPDGKVQELETTVKGLADMVKDLTEQLKKKDLDDKKSKEERLNAYREEQIKSKGLPEKIAKLIPNTSKKDIDEAIQAVIEDFSEVLKSIPTASSTGKQHSGSLLTGNTRPKITNPANPSFTNLNISVNDIAEMSNEDYAEFREKNQGMFSGGQSFGFQRMTQRKQ